MSFTEYKIISYNQVSDHDASFYCRLSPGQEIATVDVWGYVRWGGAHGQSAKVETGLDGTCVMISFRRWVFMGLDTVSLYTETPTEGHTLDDIRVALRKCRGGD